MKITINGIPIPKKRPRFRKIRNFVTTYDPQVKEKLEIKRRLERYLANLFDCGEKKDICEIEKIASSKNFDVKLKFYLPVNKSDSVSTRNKKLWGIIPANTKPDNDNLEKFILDCANGILYGDDALITSLSSEKIFSENPRTEIEIMSKKDFAGMSMKPFEVFSPMELKEFVEDAEEIVVLFRQVSGEVIGLHNQEWFQSTSSLLTKFSTKYEDKLRKISLSEKKTIKEGKTLC